MKKYLFTLMMASIAISCTQPKVQNSTKTPVFTETDNDRDLVPDILTTILEQLKLKHEDCYSDWILKEPMPGNERLTIWLIPEITLYSKEDYGHKYFNLDGHVLLADTETGKIVSKYGDPYKFEIGGTYGLVNISIDSLDYHLNDDKIVFSITESIQGSSSVFVSGYIYTNLFVQQGDSLHCILSYSTYDYNGEEGFGPEGYSSRVKKYKTKLMNMENKTNGFYDIALQTDSYSDVIENGEDMPTNVSSDSILFFNYQEDGYKPSDNK